MSRSARLWIGFGSAAIAAGAVALWLVVVSTHDDHKVRAIALGLFVGWSFIASGLVAWTRRPENHTGRLLVAAGFTFSTGALFDSNHSLPFTIASGNGVSGDACDKSWPQTKKRTIGRRLSVL